MNIKLILLLIFSAALIIRFLYFPENVYFGFDQARDSFASLEILKGNLKIIGPPSSANENLYHGPLIYYVYAPIYLISKNPELVSFVFRLFNACGVILVFLMGKNLFNNKIGLIASLIFAVSYEQSQYSLFISHPALAVVTVLIFYTGLSLLIFKKKSYGLIISLLGLGLSIQFHYVNMYLLVVLLILLIINRKKLNLTKTGFFLSLVCLSITLSTFLIAEIKFHFKFLTALFSGGGKLSLHFSEVGYVLNRFIHDNILLFYSLTPLLILIFTVLVVWLLKDKEYQSKLLFLCIWFLSGLIPYLLSGSPSYYYNAGSSIGLLLFVSLLILKLFNKSYLIGVSILILIVMSNLFLIINQNKLGPNNDIVIQPSMLTADEKRVLDYIYQKADGKPFSVSAITVPLNINTTWSYLFEWYGLQKYHYLPIWGTEAAAGFYGNLEVETVRSNLPPTRFLIIEPTIGIPDYHKDNFIKEEDYFSKIVEKKKFGTLTIQYREQI